MMTKIKKSTLTLIAIFLIGLSKAAYGVDNPAPIDLLANAKITVSACENKESPQCKKVIEVKRGDKSTLAFHAVFQVKNLKQFVSLTPCELFQVAPDEAK
jgi:hypothetical protein